MLSSRAKIAFRRGSPIAPLPSAMTVEGWIAAPSTVAGSRCLSIAPSSARRAYAAEADASPHLDVGEEGIVLGKADFKHLLSGPITPLIEFATSPPPPPDPSRYMVPAASPEASALDFRLPFRFAKVMTPPW